MEVIQIGAEWCGPCKIAKTAISKQNPKNYVYLELGKTISEDDFKKVYVPISKKSSIPQFFMKDSNGELHFIGVGASGQVMGKVKQLLK